MSRCLGIFYLEYFDEIILCINEQVRRKQLLAVSLEEVTNIFVLVWISDSEYLQHCLFESDIFVEYEE